MIYGYKRVSTAGQTDGNSFEEQETKIRETYPTAVMFEEAYSGAKERPVFSSLLELLVAGDTLVVTKLDRFCRTTKEGLEYIDQLMARGVKIHILNMGLIEDTPMGRMMVTMLLAFAEFERAQIIERTQGGKAIAKQREGFREGRKPIEVPEYPEYAKEVAAGRMTVKEAIKGLGISRSKWYRLQGA